MVKVIVIGENDTSRMKSLAQAFSDKIMPSSVIIDHRPKNKGFRKRNKKNRWR